MTRNLKKLEAWIDARLWKGVSETERQILINYKIALDDIRKTLGKVYEKYASGGVLTHAEMTKYNRLKNLHDQLTGIMGPTLSKNGKLVEKLSEVQYEESYYMHAWAIDQTGGVALRWGLLDEAAVKAAVEAGGWRDLQKIVIKDLSQDALIKIDRAVTQGIIRGLPYEKMAKEIKHAIEINAARAQTIAQTEAHRAMVQGQKDNYIKAGDMGIELKQVWTATLDDRTRPSHAQMDGEVADENGMFHAPWGLTSGPGQEGPPEEVINCRCRITGEIEGYEANTRWSRNAEGKGELIPMTNFTDWAKDRGLEKNIYGREYK
jgi:SPP1 gp7 family putative phage head morphogenesis protein